MPFSVPAIVIKACVYLAVHMFRKKAAEVPSLPEPPSIEAILEDLAKAEPDDVVFTVDLSDPQQLIALANETSIENFQLPKRFKVCVCAQPLNKPIRSTVEGCDKP